MFSWWRRNLVTLESSREAVRDWNYLTPRERRQQRWALVPVLASGGLISLTNGFLWPDLPGRYLLLGALVWVLATTYPVARLRTRHRALARQRRRAARRPTVRKARPGADADADADNMTGRL